MLVTKMLNIKIFSVCLLTVFLYACGAEDLGSHQDEFVADQQAQKGGSESQSAPSLSNHAKVCEHWVLLAPVIHNNIKLAKEFVPDDYLNEVRQSYDLDQMPKDSGGYLILNNMINAADQGRSANELEAIASKTCESLPPDAADHSGGAYGSATEN